jgi:simple sugar transport system ATP-binding protein
MTSGSGSLAFPVSGTAVPPFLEMQGIHKRFAGVHALRGISMDIRRGEIYHLMGENGCGKSTLIKIIAGALTHDEGEFLIDGESHPVWSPIDSLSAGIETVYQDLSLIPNLSVAENIGLTEQLVRHRGKLARPLERRRIMETARRALEAVHLPSGSAFATTRVDEIPLAQRQLVAIARAIATHARLVIMDEPTTSLTKKEVDNLVRVVEGLRQQGVAILFVSHKLDECLAIGGEVVVVKDGNKVAQGRIRDFTKLELSHLMTGKHIGGTRYRSARPEGEALMAVSALTRKERFKDVGFQLNRGEILGFTGLLDSGRNELALALAGVLCADTGVISIGGEQVHLATPADAIRAGVGYVPEDRLSEGLFLGKSIQENIIVSVLGSLQNRLGLLDGDRARGLADKTVAHLKIATPDVVRPVQSLSGGNQQRVLIGRWLAIKPRVLILHGPTVGVDVGSKDTIYLIIQRLADQGIGVIIISDDLPELLQNCDRVLVMRKGRICEAFDAQKLTEQMLYHAMTAEDSVEESA